MLHALGFSVSLFAFYRDSEGRPLTPRGENGKPKLNEELQTRQWSDRVIRKEKRRWKVRGGYVTKEVQVVVTPKVKEEVRKHYGCDTLSGAELEDQGEEGTALTHWEKRLFEVNILLLLLLSFKVPVFYCLMKKFKSLDFYQNIFVVIFNKSR